MKKNHPSAAAAPKKVWAMWLVNIGLLAIVAATAMPLLHIGVTVSRYIYAAGALVLIAGRLCQPGVAPGASLRLRRMMRLETWSAIIFIVAAVLLFYPGTAGTRDWIAFTLAGGVIQVYTSLMIPKLLKNEKFDN